jgi:hypothetical protein
MARYGPGWDSIKLNVVPSKKKRIAVCTKPSDVMYILKAKDEETNELDHAITETFSSTWPRVVSALIQSPIKSLGSPIQSLQSHQIRPEPPEPPTVSQQRLFNSVGGNKNDLVLKSNQQWFHQIINKWNDHCALRAYRLLDESKCYRESLDTLLTEIQFQCTRLRQINEKTCHRAELLAREHRQRLALEQQQQLDLLCQELSINPPQSLESLLNRVDAMPESVVEKLYALETMNRQLSRTKEASFSYDQYWQGVDEFVKPLIEQWTDRQQARADDYSRWRTLEWDPQESELCEQVVKVISNLSILRPSDGHCALDYYQQWLQYHRLYQLYCHALEEYQGFAMLKKHWSSFSNSSTSHEKI